MPRKFARQPFLCCLCVTINRGNRISKLMTADNPTILALDFDGVICDGLIEYFETAWRTYCQIWLSADRSLPSDELASSFYQLRPVIETGWEMPVLIRALVLGIPKEEISQNWLGVTQRLLQEADITAAEIGKQLDQLRDEEIRTDENRWLSLHRFYPGVVERLARLQASPVQLVIITTKEGRFVRQLLQPQGVQLSEQAVIGKESKRPKYQILKELEQKAGSSYSIWFVEDRLKTLQLVKQHLDLQYIKLYLADWGYNTKLEREAARQDPQIQLLSLSQFTQDFSHWPSPPSPLSSRERG